MFVLREDGALTPMKPTHFDQETDFQELLEKYPALLAGDLIDRDNPRVWLLVGREVGIPIEADGNAWWAVDHIFLDQDGIPTIVEVKRQTDTRLRREVVGQLLDYAANMTANLPFAALQARFIAHCVKNNVDADERLREVFGPSVDSGDYWKTVKTNLEAQKIRLLFVADRIPRELARVVEFLNRQMNPAEVLALELRQFSGEHGLRTIVPTIYGQTEEARGAKFAGPVKVWDEETIYKLIELKQGKQITELARKVGDWMKANTNPYFGRGKVDGSMNALLMLDGQKLYPLALYTTGKIYIGLMYCKFGVFKVREERLKLLDKLNEIPGIALPPEAIDKYPPIMLSSLSTASLDKFLSVMTSFVSALREDLSLTQTEEV